MEGLIPVCMYGAQCRRKNPTHWLQFSHPGMMGREEVAPSNMADKQVSGGELETPSSDAESPVLERCYLDTEDNDQADDRPEGSAGKLQQLRASEKVVTANLGERSREIIIVILVGLPGSGKSTFCAKVVHSGNRRWTRICQDIICNGRRGSKEQCLRQATIALQGHSNILIDRCNLNKDQRHDFIELARQNNIAVHAVILDLPVKLCIHRAIQRTGHEGGLQGKTAAAAIQRMSQTKEFPSSSEGFSLIICCQSDNDIEKATRFYQQLDGALGFQMQTSENADKNQEGNICPLLHNTNSCPEQESQEERGGQEKIYNMISQEHQMNSTLGRDVEKTLWKNMELRDSKEIENTFDKGVPAHTGSSSLNEGARTLAFPSISTSDFKFDHEKAADIMIGRISEFLFKYEWLGARLVLVDINKDSDMLLRVQQKAKNLNLDSKRFLILAGDITRLYSGCSLQCNFIANTTNWRLKPGGGGVNAAVFKAAGEELEVETRKRSKTLSPGSALVVPLSIASPLHMIEGVTHVIHVLGPNMNPQRPNYLGNDYEQGCKVLDNAYGNLFESFASVVHSELHNTADHDLENRKEFRKTSNHWDLENSTTDKSHGKSRNAFELLMEASKRKYKSASEQKAKSDRQAMDNRNDKQVRMDIDFSPSTVGCDIEKLKHKNLDMGGAGTSKLCQPYESVEAEGKFVDRGGNVIPNVPIRDDASRSRVHWQTESHGEKSKSSKTWGAWAESLRDIALHPEKHKDVLLQVSDDAVVIVDKFPKSKKHVLVVARMDGLDSISELQISHLPLLEYMHGLGQKWVEILLKEGDTLVFRVGYHSDPSMRQLHMHVISQDFDSPYLKNRKHWNSFTTSFFRDSKDVIEELRKTGRVQPYCDEASLLKTELRCHRCHSAHPNMPRLMKHIRSCDVPFSLQLMQHGYLISATS